MLLPASGGQVAGSAGTWSGADLSRGYGGGRCAAVRGPVDKIYDIPGRGHFNSIRYSPFPGAPQIRESPECWAFRAIENIKKVLSLIDRLILRQHLLLCLFPSQVFVLAVFVTD